MKKSFKFLSMLLLTGFAGCDTVDFGDINENPNGTNIPSASGLLGGVIMSMATDGAAVPSLFVQYQAQVAYTDEMLYAQVPYDWGGYYLLISSLNTVISLNSDPATITPELLLQGSPENQKATAMILKALVVKRIADAWGDAPVKESGKGLEELTPQYDTQEDIYKQIVADLQGARNLIDIDEAPPTGDILYFGNMLRWQKLTNSLLIQIAVQLSKRYPEPSGYAATVFNEAYKHPAGYIRDLDDEAWFYYENLNGLRNPWSAYRVADYYLSKEFTDALKGNINANSLNPTSNSLFDDRYSVYVQRTWEYPDPDGVPYGYRDGDADLSSAQMNNRYFWNTTSPLPLMTASYTYLNIAEASVLGWTDASAYTMLRNGIVKSFESLQEQSKASLENPDGEWIIGGATSYAAARVSDAEFVPGGILQIIGEEKWVSLFGQPYDAWTEFRRTGYPNLKPAHDHYNKGEIPTRYIYPREEATLNTTNYREAVSRIGTDENTSRLWWDID